MFLTVTDVTETKSIERAEREIRDRLRAVIDHLPAGLVLKDEQGKYLLANQQFMELYGLQAKDMISGTADDYFPHPQAEIIDAQDRPVLRTGIPMEAEMEVQRQIGRASGRERVWPCV